MLGLFYFISYFYSESCRTNTFDKDNNLKSFINKIDKWRFAIKIIRYIPHFFFENKLKF